MITGEFQIAVIESEEATVCNRSILTIHLVQNPSFNNGVIVSNYGLVCSGTVD